MNAHIRTVVSGPFDVTNDANCMCHPMHPATHAACPRHQPAAYADSYARHATDSIGPLWTPAERFHSSNQFGR